MAIAAKESYETANEQLKDEIPKFIEARVGYFGPVFEALVKIQIDYYARSYQTLLPLQKYFNESSVLFLLLSANIPPPPVKPLQSIVNLPALNRVI